MSLIALSRYDDAEDEIHDEDHNLILKSDEGKSDTPTESASRPPSEIGKSKSLVSYIGGDYSDDDEEDEGDVNSNDDDTPLKHGNFGLYDGSTVVSSAGSASPNSVNEIFDATEAAKDPVDGVRLPPEPEGRCSKSLQEKIARMIEKKNSGLNVNEYVQRKKEYRNPSIYEKLVTYIGIDEHGTNFPRHLYNPSVWGTESHYDALAKAQKEHHDKKEREKLKEKRAQIEFVTTTKKSTAPTTGASTEKKSKWDQKMPPLLQAAVKTNEKVK